MFGVTAILLIAALCAIINMLVNYSHQYWKRKGVPQVEPMSFIFGNYGPIFKSKKSVQFYFRDLYREVKSRGDPYAGIYLTWFPELVPVNLELIKRIMITDFSYFAAHGFYHHKTDLLTMHLFNLEGQVWRDRRNKITPAFTAGKMRMMFEIVACKASELNKVIGNFVKTDKPLKIQEMFANYTMDVITTVAFGLDIDTLHNSKSEFREISKHVLANDKLGGLVRAFIPFKLLGLLGHKTRPKFVRDYFSRVVLDTISYREQNNVQRNDFIQMMINLKNYGSLEGDSSNIKDKLYLTEEEIISESFLMFFAGFETTSTAMTCTFSELALPQNQHIQEKLRQEILQSMENNDGKIVYEELLKIEYLDKVFKETLRKYPVVTVIPRTCTKDYTLPDCNVVIKKGTKVNIPVLGIHMDEEYYHNPEIFDPENFSKEKIASRPDFTWLPFGEGPRQCLGLRFAQIQAKMGIASVLSKYRFTLMDENIKLPFEPGMSSQVFTFKHPLMLKVKAI